MSPVIQSAKLAREPDEPRSSSPGPPRRSSASLNDNFVDISVHHQLPRNCVVPTPTKSTCMGTLNVGAPDEENTANP